MNTSSGQFPRRRHPGERGIDPDRAVLDRGEEFATASERLWWAWTPISVVGSSTSR